MRRALVVIALAALVVLGAAVGPVYISKHGDTGYNTLIWKFSTGHKVRLQGPTGETGLQLLSVSGAGSYSPQLLLGHGATEGTVAQQSYLYDHGGTLEVYSDTGIMKGVVADHVLQFPGGLASGETTASLPACTASPAAINGGRLLYDTTANVLKLCRLAYLPDGGAGWAAIPAGGAGTFNDAQTIYFDGTPTATNFALARFNCNAAMGTTAAVQVLSATPTTAGTGASRFLALQVYNVTTGAAAWSETDLGIPCAATAGTAITGLGSFGTCTGGDILELRLAALPDAGAASCTTMPKMNINLAVAGSPP